MALGKYKIEGGKKRGHSNVNHWEETETIKKRTKKLRRKQDKKIEREARKDYIE